MNRRRGFTLLEMLVVIALAGIILAVVLSSLGKVGTEAKASGEATKIMNEARSIADAQLRYFMDYGSYAGDPGTLVPDYLKALPNGWTYDGTSNRGLGTDAVDHCMVFSGISLAVCQEIVKMSGYAQYFILHNDSGSSTVWLLSDCGSSNTLYYCFDVN